MPKQGENNQMNDSVHQMSLLVGEIKGELRAVKASVENLNTVWGQREQAANDGRRTVHEKVDGMRTDLMRLGAEFENVCREVAVIKPAIDEFKTARDQHAGAAKLGRRLWIGAVSLSGMVGGMLAELFHRIH